MLLFRIKLIIDANKIADITNKTIVLVFFIFLNILTLIERNKKNRSKKNQSSTHPSFFAPSQARETPEATLFRLAWGWGQSADKDGNYESRT